MGIKLKTNKIKTIKSKRLSIILLLGLYILLTELIKATAEVYIIERSFELKLLLFSSVLVILYEIPNSVIVTSMIGLLFLSIFGIQTGLAIYVLAVSALIKLVISIRKPSV